MKTSTLIGIASSAILSFGMATVSAADIPSGLSAHISAATNRVSTLGGLEFRIVLTNSGFTNVTIYPLWFIYVKPMIALCSSEGRLLVQVPKPSFFPPGKGAEPMERSLKPGESFTFTNKLGDAFVPNIDGIRGKYHARCAGSIPSNDVEITVE